MNELEKALARVKRACAYARKSRDEAKDEEQGKAKDVLETQRIELSEIMPRFEFPFDYKEEVISGDSISERPEFQDLLEGIEDGTYQAIACRSIDRLGRGDYKDMGRVFDLVVEKRVLIITKDNIYDPSNQEHLTYIRFMFFFAREEYEMIKSRLKNGKRNKAKTGKWVNGSVPFGYDYSSKEKILVVNQDEALVVKYIFGLYLKEGYGLKKISTHFHRTGILSPEGKARWSIRTIERILRNPVYKGTSFHQLTKVSKISKKIIPQDPDKHIIVEDAHEAIIDKEMWQATQDRMDNPVKKTPKNTMDFTPAELAGVVDCKCGRRLVRQYHVQNYHSKKKGLTKYHREYLYCSECSYTVNYQEVLEGVVKSLERYVLMDESTLQKELVKFTSVSQRTHADRNGILKKQEEKLKKLVERKKFIFDKYESGIYDDETFVERRKEIDTSIEETKQAIEFAKGQIQSDKQGVDTKPFREQIKSTLELFERMEDERQLRNKLLLATFDQIEFTLIEKCSRKKKARFDLAIQFSREFLQENIL